MKNKLIYLVTLFLIGGFLITCKQEEYVSATSEDVLIGAYFEKNPDNFSKFYQLLEASGNLSFLNAYGTYTCFAPTNAAIDKYLEKTGKKSITEFSKAELSALVRYHIIIDTLNSTQFTDGKLPKPTMYGQYLTVRTYFEAGTSKLKINKYAEITSRDYRAANGIVHSVNTVLEPVTKSIAELIQSNPEFSIFSAALKATKLADTLSLMPTLVIKGEDKRWFTVLAVTDEAYKQKGINSFEDLKKKYSTTNDPTSINDSLYIYMAYHCLDQSLKYVTDLVIDRSHLTMAPLEVITIKLKADSVLVNEETFNGKLERGAPIDRLKSDNTAGNGVFHVVDKNFGVKVRLPMPLYWDVADQPEIRKLAGIYRTPGQFANIQLGQLAGTTWGTSGDITYSVDAGWMGEYYINSDYLDINLRQQGIPWIEFTTPLIVKGKYKVWICTRNVFAARRPIFIVYFNGEALPNIIDNNITISRDLGDADLELTGYKRYNFNPADTAFQINAGERLYTDAGGRFVARLAGTVDVPTTGSHKIKFSTINDGRDHIWLDMIQFIPFDSEQTWPRLNKNGILIDRPVE